MIVIVTFSALLCAIVFMGQWWMTGPSGDVDAKSSITDAPKQAQARCPHLVTEMLERYVVSGVLGAGGLISHSDRSTRCYNAQRALDDVVDSQVPQVWTPDRVHFAGRRLNDSQ